MLFNSRSVTNKTSVIYEKVVHDDLDLLALTETWLNDTHDMPCIGQLTPSGYTFRNAPGKTGKGGGVGLLYKSNLKVKFKPNLAVSFEHIYCTLAHKSKAFRILVIYRLPSKGGNTNQQFIDEMAGVLAELSASKEELLIIGDLNLHLDSNTSPMFLSS